MTVTSAAPDMEEPSWQRPGGLAIIGDRTWRTSQLVMIALSTLLLGLAVGYGQRGSPAPSEGSSSGASASPAPSVAPVPTITMPSQTTVANSAAAESPATTADVSPTTAGAGGGASSASTVLVELQPTTGPKTSSDFKVGPGGWKVGWAYNCSRAGGQGPFEIKVQNADGSAGSEPTVSRTGVSEKGVESYQTSGSKTLVVTTTCLWTLKATGVAG